MGGLSVHPQPPSPSGLRLSPSGPAPEEGPAVHAHWTLGHWPEHCPCHGPLLTEGRGERLEGGGEALAWVQWGPDSPRETL